MSHKGSLLGPVGFAFITLGYIIAIVVARLFVSIESVCTQLCPVMKIEGVRFHHMYYGLVLAFVSSIVLLYAQDIRTRWDSALLMGVGMGLVADEIGLLVLKVAYWNVYSLAILIAGGASLAFAMGVAAFRDGWHEFRYLDRYQLLSMLGLLLGFTGFLYFDRPIRIIVQLTALSAWLSSVILVTKYGYRHFWLIRHMPLSYEPQPR